MKWQYSAGIIPFRKKGKNREYLLLLSSLTKEELWEFPKGQIEKGESAPIAASREFEEETGIQEWQMLPDFKKVFKYFYRLEGALIGKTVTYFLGEVFSKKVNISAESKDYVWASVAEAEEKIKHKNLREALHEAEKFLNGLLIGS